MMDVLQLQRPLDARRPRQGPSQRTRRDRETAGASASWRRAPMTLEEKLAGWTVPSVTERGGRSGQSAWSAKRSRRMQRSTDAPSASTRRARIPTTQMSGSTAMSMSPCSAMKLSIGRRSRRARVQHRLHTEVFGRPPSYVQEVVGALRAKFPGQVDSSGRTAVVVHSSTARIDADVVPCFGYHYYFTSGGYREGQDLPH